MDVFIRRDLRLLDTLSYARKENNREVTFISNFVPVVASRPCLNKSGTR
ncbi:unnamed protein product [Larinioides sclopetarius]|uniref:Uncharacterized protein n=1 Tax=Larinioides sclopetarius TaxID=280406 RepID=A0AAV2BWY5_9ARAC